MNFIMNVLNNHKKTINPKKNLDYWLIGFLILVPIINGLASVTTNYFPPATTNPGFFRIILLLLFIILAFPRSYVPNYINNAIIFFVLYWYLLIPFSSNIQYNLIQSPKVILSLLLFPFAYYYINTINRFKLLLGFMLVAWSFFILNFFIANIYNIGYHGYGGAGSSLYFG